MHFMKNTTHIFITLVQPENSEGALVNRILGNAGVVFDRVTINHSCPTVLVVGTDRFIGFEEISNYVIGQHLPKSRKENKRRMI
jgi:hypothetical protein